MKKIFFSIALILLVTSCQDKKFSLGFIPDNDVCVGLNYLKIIKPGPNNILVNDFIMDESLIDSVSTNSEHIFLELSDNKKLLDIYCDEDLEQMSVVSFWIKGIHYDVPLRRSDKIWYTFTYNPNGKEIGRIQIAGQMNNWVADMTPDLTLNEDGLYEVKMLLSPGTYLYQLKIDGDQNHDDTNPNMVDNGFGKFNSILQVDGNDAKFPMLLTDDIDDDKIKLIGKGKIDRVWAYIDNLLLDDRFIKIETEDDKYEIKIYLPTELKDCRKTYLRVWASNEFGISNDILVPIIKGKPVEKACVLDRNDKYNNIIYFLLVDRFKNGDVNNDHPMNRADVNPLADYQGGDLAGIDSTILNGYFNKLGINTLWISPLNQNPLEPYGYSNIANTKFAGYHGYWPISSSKVDFRFGTNDELKSLVKDAHNKNINVLLDYVANHVHEQHPLYQSHPEYATDLYLPDGRMNVELWDEQRLTTWFDTFMPSLDFSNPYVVELMVDSAVYWFKEFGIDGFRHDACKHVNQEFWRALTYKLKQYDNNGYFYQIGESYGSPELMASYVNSGMLNGQFDFNVYDEANSAFNGVSGGTMKRLSNILNSSLKVYGVHNLMGYISGNHDKPRFMALASGDLKVGEDAKAAAWTRKIGITDSVAYDKLALFHTFNTTIPGVPVIYYGDEIGMTGGNDPDCRRMMYFDNWNNREENLFDHVAKLNHLRTSNMALIYGDYIELSVDENVFAYARKYFDTTVVVFINNTDKPYTFNVNIDKFNGEKEDYKALFGNDYQYSGDYFITITLPALSSEVLY